MPTATLTIRTKRNSRKILVELDAVRFERLAAGLGLFRPEFLKSLERAEHEIAQGKARRLRFLRDLRRA